MDTPNPKALSKPGPFEMGPQGWTKGTRADGLPETDLTFDPSVLNSITARLWKTAPFADPVLAIEVLYGAYKGAIFAFSSFEVLPLKMENGLVPTRFETTIFHAPEGFIKDETFDLFCSEILLSWLHYLATNDLQPFIKSPIQGVH